MNSSRVGWAWVLLCGAMAVHTADEATHGFLSVYNATVLGRRARAAWLPLPTFGFTEWLAGLIAVNILLLALTVFLVRGSKLMRRIAWVFACIMVLNAIAHTVGTIFGRTLASVRFPRPMPGFYSSPLLLAAAVHLLYQLTVHHANATTEPRA
ncbi:MAG: hypothetical protein NTZ98_04760 [Acidobacteria bacterium]|nr:hypothetical protein [Acidobacteriota bacterium]